DFADHPFEDTIGFLDRVDANVAELVHAAIDDRLNLVVLRGGELELAIECVHRAHVPCVRIAPRPRLRLCDLKAEIVAGESADQHEREEQRGDFPGRPHHCCSQKTSETASPTSGVSGSSGGESAASMAIIAVSTTATPPSARHARRCHSATSDGAGADC